MTDREQYTPLITDPAHLRERAPSDGDRSLVIVGTVKLTTVGAPADMFKRFADVRSLYG
jgi:hypothetical protein